MLAYGRLSDRITDDKGQPVASALVQIYDGKSDTTDIEGQFSRSLKEVPLGKYEVDASRVIDGSLYSALVAIDLQTSDRVVDVRLSPPAACYRRAQIHLDAWGIDGDGLGKDDITDPGADVGSSNSAPTKR